jgi:sensor domain CHASE-containing protein
MSDSRTLEWNFTTRILVPLVLAGATTILLVAGVLFYATSEGDRLSWDRQRLLVSHVLSDQVDKIAHDQESVTLWDDALRNTKLNFDKEWVDVNLGIWMFDYFGHDRVFVLNDQNEPIYAMADGAGADIGIYEPDRKTITPLAQQLRALLRTSAPGDALADPGKYRAADLVVIESRPAIASVMPILSEAGEIEQAPGYRVFRRRDSVSRRQLPRRIDAAVPA